jgi:diaminopimelate dehydrogenase
MKRLRIAIIGFGSLGRACAGAARDCAQLELAGIVRRNVAPPREAPFRSLPVATHLRDLGAVDVALLCVPAAATLEVARELLQQGTAIVECGGAGGQGARSALRCARPHRGAISLVRGHGRGLGSWRPDPASRRLRNARAARVSELTRRPAARLHHTVATDAVPGVRAALASEIPPAAGEPPHRYLYVELSPGARLDKVEAALVADPVFAGERTHVFAVDDVAKLEAKNHGVTLTRRGTALSGAHETLLMEGRFDPTVLAARAMLDAARKVSELGAGGHRYCLSQGV